MTDKIGIILKRVLQGALVLLVSLSALALGYRSYEQGNIRSKVKINSPNGVQSLEAVQIGGIDQWVKIRGHDLNNPILLFLHGGPGTPELPISHLFDTKLEHHFTLVHWDQRASGKTRRSGFSESDLTVEQFVDDTISLTNYLRNRFDKDKIYLLGHSWGTMLGVEVVRRHPELFHAYVGMGQVVSLTDSEILSLDYVRIRAAEDHNEEALSELEGLEPPYAENPEQLGIQRGWLYHYGGGYRNTSPAELMRTYLTSPDYSLLDIFSFVGGVTTLAPYMWPEMVSYDFRKNASQLDLPVYFFAGRYDYNTPSSLARQYFDIVKAPSKEFIWFEESAHFMNISDPDFYQETLINKVLANTRAE